MRINLVSYDQLWLDALSMSLDLLCDCEVKVFNSISLAVEASMKAPCGECLLMVDSSIPGVDYWELVAWLDINFRGKLIIFSSAGRYSLYAEKMMRAGCYAVVDKADGFVACWRAIQLATQDVAYCSSQEMSPFSQLKDSEQKFAAELLHYDVGELSSIKGITQQAVNKKKLSIYRKLNISSVPGDKTFRILANLFQLQ